MDNGNLSARVYEDIKDMLINLVFLPGTPLRERVLVDRLGVSRTPIREALQRLAHEGWLQIGDGKRIQVSPVTTKDVKQLFDLRLLIEPYAAREAFEQGKSRLLAGKLDEALTMMKDNLEDYTLFAHMDLQFHLLIIEMTENERLIRFWKTTHEETSRVAQMTLVNEKRAPVVTEEHSEILHAFWERDLDSILDNLSQHLLKSRDSLLKKLKENGKSSARNTAGVRKTVSTRIEKT